MAVNHDRLRIRDLLWQVGHDLDCAMNDLEDGLVINGHSSIKDAKTNLQEVAKLLGIKE